MSFERMKEVIEKFEGNFPKVYEDTRGIKTIGVGFNLEQSDARELFQNALPMVDFDDVVSGRTSLTNDQVSKLFEAQLKIKIQVAVKLFPKYYDYPSYVQIALVNGVFRGEFKASHKTVKLINKEEWSKVADEYLDRDDYRGSIPGKNGGIKKRMDYNASQFRKYAASLK
ncbi:uncharacterized protein LOC124440156 [Xenia sp. Carnegie-2017]|uniref:uncharacterized protein LOC124440156 n=1 Tax=Xenia sp. Carnegie-2017 TaxID=2897299 RepID=UPI001F034C80|nr:uncharacterized protein LOC124440156 [Xenia sp. Carnegie-2017]